MKLRFKGGFWWYRRSRSRKVRISTRKVRLTSTILSSEFNPCQYCVVVVVKVVLTVLCSSYPRTSFMHAVMNEHMLALAKMLTTAADASVLLSPLAAGTLLTQTWRHRHADLRAKCSPTTSPSIHTFMERLSFISPMTDSWERWGRRDLTHMNVYRRDTWRRGWRYKIVYGYNRCKIRGLFTSSSLFLGYLLVFYYRQLFAGSSKSFWFR